MSTHFSLCMVCAAGITLSLLSSTSVQAESLVIPDGTLDASSSVVTELDALNQLIEGGAVRGSNLFHSFSEFNVTEGHGVYFANPAAIKSILTRVTGANPSNIFGTLGVNGLADLFLMNPNGIVFGENASLSINGSFYATTATAIPLGDGVFSAVAPQSSSLLAVEPGALFLSHLNEGSGDIASEAQLVVGEDLTLAGQNLQVQGQMRAGQGLTLLATDTVTIRDTPVEAFAANSGRDLTIQGNQGVDILALNHLDQTPFVSGGDLILMSDGLISGDAHFASGGSLQILTLAGTPGNFVSLYDPIIFADGDVVFGSYTGAALKIEATGSIQAGGIRIIGPDTTFTPDGSGSDEDLLASSRALILRAGLAEVNSPTTLPVSEGGTTFETGDVDEQPPGSILANRISTADLNGGDGGPIILEAEGNIEARALNSSARSDTGDSGNGGAININSANGTVRIRAELDSRSRPDNVAGNNAGNGGAVTITAADDIRIGSVNSRSRRNDESLGIAGNAGAVTIISMNGAVQIDRGIKADTQSSSLGSTSAGDGGAIEIRAEGNITINNDAVDSGVNSGDGNGGNGGSITLISESGSIRVNQTLESASRSSTLNTGNGGDVTLEAAGDININGEVRSFARSFRGNAGGGGDINIAANSGNVTVSGELEAFSRSNADDPGNGGNIDVTAGGDISIVGGLDSFSLSNNSDAGNGGRISLKAPSGNVQIDNDEDTPDEDIEDTLINTYALSSSGGATGNGGNVALEAVNILGDEFGLDIVTLASGGNAGSVTIRGTGETSEIDRVELITSGQIEIPEPFGDGVILQDLSNVGQSGDTLITGAGDITLNNVIIRSDANSSMDAGSITFADAGNVEINNSQILSDTNADGNGGAILFSNLDRLTLDGSTVTVDTDGSGDAGSIEFLNSGNVQISNSQILSDTNANGNGSNIRFQDLEGLTLNNSTITTDTQGLGGDAGDISVNEVGLLSLNNNSLLLAAAAIGANAGNIAINTDAVTAAPGENNDIIANAVGGRGGEVSVDLVIGDLTVRTGFTVDELRAMSSNDVSASATGGPIINPDPDENGDTDLPSDPSDDISDLLEDFQARQGNVALISGATPTPVALPGDFLDPDTLIAGSCIAPGDIRRTRVEGSLYFIGTSGLPQQPGDTGFATFSTGDVQVIPADTAIEEDPEEWQLGDDIMEPDGVYQLTDGRFVIGRTCAD